MPPTYDYVARYTHMCSTSDVEIDPRTPEYVMAVLFEVAIAEMGTQRLEVTIQFEDGYFTLLRENGKGTTVTRSTPEQIKEERAK